MASLSSLLLSVGTSFFIFLICTLVFVFLSRHEHNFPVYYAARLYAGRSLPPNAHKRGYLEWLKDALKTSHDEILEFAGIDATVYMIFLTTALKIFSSGSFFGTVVLMPLCYTDDYYSSYNANQTDPNNYVTYSTLDLLGMGNLTRGSIRLLAFVFCAYCLSFSVFYFLYQSSVLISELYVNEFQTSICHAQRFSLLVRDIPKSDANVKKEEQIERFFSNIYSKHYLGCVVVKKMDIAESLWQEMEKNSKKLQRARALHLRRNFSNRSFHNCFNLFKKKIHSVEYYETEIMRLSNLLHREQKRVEEEEEENHHASSAFVFFDSHSEVVKACQVVHSMQSDKWMVEIAPRSTDVRWTSLSLSIYECQIRNFLIAIAVFCIIIFFLIPATFISALTTLASLEALLPFLSPLLELSLIKYVVEAYLPQTVLLGMINLVFFIMVFLSNLESWPGAGYVRRSTAQKYFYFLFLNVFIGITVSGTLFNSVRQLVTSPVSIFTLLGHALPPNATFFVTYVALEFFVGYGVELSQLFALITYHFGDKVIVVTESERKEIQKPPKIKYYRIIPYDLLNVTLGLCYSIIAPIILPFVTLYFLFAYITYKNQILNVYRPEKIIHRSSFWPQIHSQTLFALFVAQITLIGYFAIQKFMSTIVLIPLPFLTFVYVWASNLRFKKAFEYPPLELIDDSKLPPPPPLEDLILEYTPLCLHKEEIRGVVQDMVKEGSFSSLDFENSTASSMFSPLLHDDKFA